MNGATHCVVDAADDAVYLKSYHPGYANDDIYIADCTIRSIAYAVKFGTGSFGGFINVTIENYPEFSMFRELPAWGLYSRLARKIQPKNVHLMLDDDDFRPSLVLDDVHIIQMKDGKLTGTGEQPQVILKNVASEEIDFPGKHIPVIE